MGNNYFTTDFFFGFIIGVSSCLVVIMLFTEFPFIKRVRIKLSDYKYTDRYNIPIPPPIPIKKPCNHYYVLGRTGHSPVKKCSRPKDWSEKPCDDCPALSSVRNPGITV